MKKIINWLLSFMCPYHLPPAGRHNLVLGVQQSSTWPYK